MKNLFRTMTLAVLCTPFVVAQSSNVTLPQDKGPDKIDVSGYPAEMQAGYKVFATKCSKCHTIARPINTMMTRAEWERYVKRMMHKPNSGISDKQGKDIFEFLVYDQTNRKDKDSKAFFPALSDEAIDKLKQQQ
jgi:mono/diheme cytochrome c family protein